MQERIAIIAVAMGIMVYGIQIGLTLLFSRQGNSKAKKIMGWLTLLYALCLLNYSIYYTGSIAQWKAFLGTTTPLFFLLGPFVILYIDALHTPSFQIKPYHLVYFLPFIMWQIYFIPFFFMESYAQDHFISEFLCRRPSSKGFIFDVSNIMANGLFLSLSIRSLNKIKVENIKMPNEADSQSIFWTSTLLKIFSLLLLSNLISLVFRLSLRKRIYPLEWLVALVFVALIVAAGIHMFTQNKIYKQRRLSAKYLNSILSTKQKQHIKKELTQLMDVQKVYLQPDLKIKDVAKMIDIPAYQLSQVINELVSCNFSAYINKFRITHAKKLLTELAHQDLTILAIAIASGFNHKGSFNRVFKMHVGQTPSAYREAFRERKV